MQFFKTDIGLVNLAFVLRIDRSFEGLAIFYLQDGKSGLSDQLFEDLEVDIGTFIPDHTGTQHLSISEDQGKVHHFLVPVVGWKVSKFGATPVYAAPDGDGYLVYPNGYVDSELDRSYGSIKEALEDFAATAGATEDFAATTGATL